MAACQDIVNHCNARLEIELYRDVALNGLQVEGVAEIDRLAVAVSTSERTISAAREWGAQALLVHHGLFWGERSVPLVGMLANRLRLLFRSNMNLIAYHLPLDGHDELGNNALLARQLGFRVEQRFADIAGVPLGVACAVEPRMPLDALADLVSTSLDRTPTVVGAVDAIDQIERIGILSGSGYGAIQEAAERGCQALITGDVREPTMAEARELGIAVIVAGHEATERTGVQALAGELAETFSIETRYVHDPNPI